MDLKTILFESKDGVAKISLNRPDKLNSFNETMHKELRSVLDAIEADDSMRVILLTGAGRGFCAGQDLDDRKVAPGEAPVDLGYTLENYYNPLIRTLAAIEMPVICAVNGVAAGAGANIAFACDIVLAARSAKFIQAFCKLGLVPDSGGTYHLPRLIGQARAVAISLLGTPVTAEEAEAWGMIWKVVDDERLAEESEKLAAHFAAQPTKGLAYIKKALRTSLSNTLDEQLDLERDYQRAAGQTDDYREGVAAFLEKRQPKFTGK